MSKHTPGPWRIVNSPRSSSLEVYAGDTAICELWRRADRAAEHATAKLIAAAPDLLAALKALMPILDNDGPLVAAYADIGPLVRAAIAKAEGTA